MFWRLWSSQESALAQEHRCFKKPTDSYFLTSLLLRGKCQISTLWKEHQLPCQVQEQAAQVGPVGFSMNASDVEVSMEASSLGGAELAEVALPGTATHLPVARCG